MAGMAAKMILGDKVKSVTGAIGGEDAGGNEDAAEEARLIEEARQEQEEERKAKHAKLEEEREKERQRIRDKYGLKKKEELQMMPEPSVDGRLTRQKKTPAQMQAERDAEGEEEEGIFDTVLSYLTPITDKLGINLNK